MFGRETILNKTPEAGGCTNTVDLYNPFPDGGGVALYQLNGDATDVSGNYNATDVRGLSYVDGVFGQAASFASNGNFNTGYSLSGSYSISLWCKNTATGYNIFGTSNSANDYGIMFRGLRSGAVSFIDGWGGLGVGQYVVHSYTYPQDTNWHHFVLSFTNNNNCKIYFDGQEILNFNSAQAQFVHSVPLTFGENLYASNDPTGINLDQVRIFNRALRPYEVEALYTEEYCTPTIVPSEHFNTVLYTGNSSTQSITGAGFQPDLVWIKNRDAAQSNRLYDSVRGANLQLSSNQTAAENNSGGLTSFDSNGFSLDNWASVNTNTNNYVSWNFKAGGAAVTNTDGTITSQVSANTEAGFSVVTWTDSFTTGQTVGHGLGQAPKIIMARTLDRASNLWYVSHPEDNTKSLILSSTAAQNSDLTWVKGDDTFGANWTGTSFRWLAYCFAEVEGFSSFGSYVGNGSTSGPTVVTGFEPAFLLIKQSSASGEYWNLWDNKRSVENPRSDVLFPNLSNAESSNQSWSDVQFLENGFQVTPSVMTPTNANGATYIYMAFAADPTTVEPSLEDSFNTVTYADTTTSVPHSVGFAPDLLWFKERNGTNRHQLYDTVRGSDYALFSNDTSAEYNYSTHPSGNLAPLITSNGFITPSVVNNGINRNGGTYVAWAWKGAEIPAINSNGSIPSVVSANPAAGFSIVSWTSTATTSTIGHGLESTPSIVIMKSRTNAGDWQVYSSAIGATQKLFLNGTNAATSSGVWGNTSPNENVFTSAFNNSGNIIAYCFAEVAGFSKFGSYSGNGSTSGPTITTDFEPAFVMIKSTSDAGSWIMHDNKRGNYNNGDIYARLQAESSSAEVDDYPTTKRIDISSTGFQVTTASNSWNGSGRTYIYMAFANQF